MSNRSIGNYPKIKFVDFNKDLDVFYGVSELGSPIWGRLDNDGNATEIHPLYVRNNHSNFINAITFQYDLLCNEKHSSVPNERDTFGM